MKKYLLICALALISVGAFAQKSQQTYSIVESTATFLEPSPVIVTTPLIADIKIVGDKVSYIEPDALKIFPVTNINQLKEEMPRLRSVIVGRAVSKLNVDLIVGVSFEMETTDDGKLKVTVSGYPAKYANFRNATIEDIQAVDLAKKATRDDVSVMLEGEKPVDLKTTQK